MDQLTREDGEKLLALIAAGSILSNVSYNGKQCDKLPPDWRRSMQVAYERWDAAMRAVDLNKLRNLPAAWDPALHGA